jgi:hypothetical protein
VPPPVAWPVWSEKRQYRRADAQGDGEKKNILDASEMKY